MSEHNKSIILCILLTIIQTMPTLSANMDQHSSSSLNISHIARNKSSENIIFSPLSIQTTLAMIYLGAAGKTAEEIKNSLRLPSTDKDQVGEYFAQIVNKKSGGASLSIANRMFVSSDYSLQADFNEKAEKYFNSGAETLNFKDFPSKAIEVMNSWVENKTNNKITNLMQPGSVDSETVAIIVNAIYFKGEWQEPFSKDATRKSPFWISKNEAVDVDTMFGSERELKYGEFLELDATAIEMPYKDSDLSMMIIRPSQKDGLADLERKLRSISINELSTKMTIATVDLMIPKFKIDFSTGLTDALKKMGIHSLFEKADLPGIFQSSGLDVKVSDVQHKAFIDVNEAGSEAAAASFLELHYHVLVSDLKTFTVDRPFFFAIKDSKTIYFAGHVVKF